jgi:hypothetical protein
VSPCAACGTHVRGDDACPHCGERRRAALGTAAVLLGLALGGAAVAAGCEPEYGAVVTKDQLATETADTADTGNPTTPE